MTYNQTHPASPKASAISVSRKMPSGTLTTPTAALSHTSHADLLPAANSVSRRRSLLYLRKLIAVRQFGHRAPEFPNEPNPTIGHLPPISLSTRDLAPERAIESSSFCRISHQLGGSVSSVERAWKRPVSGGPASVRSPKAGLFRPFWNENPAAWSGNRSIPRLRSMGRSARPRPSAQPREPASPR